MRLKRTGQELIANLSSNFLRCISIPRCGLRILLYHSVSSGVNFDPCGLFTIYPDTFEAQMKMLSKSTNVSLVSLPDCLKSISKSGLTVAVTFDDGYKDNLNTVAPIMQKYRIPFTVFVSTSFIQNETPEFLTSGELRELSMMPGVSIGSHGKTHKRLTELNRKDLRDELITSKQYVEDITGKEVMAISYPHGAMDSNVREAAIIAGYNIGACSRFDINNKNVDPLLLCRTTILAKDSYKVWLQKLNGAWDWYKWIDSLKYKVSKKEVA